MRWSPLPAAPLSRAWSPLYSCEGEAAGPRGRRGRQRGFCNLPRHRLPQGGPGYQVPPALSPSLAPSPQSLRDNTEISQGTRQSEGGIGGEVCGGQLKEGSPRGPGQALVGDAGSLVAWTRGVSTWPSTPAPGGAAEPNTPSLCPPLPARLLGSGQAEGEAAPEGEAQGGRRVGLRRLRPWGGAATRLRSGPNLQDKVRICSPKAANALQPPVSTCSRRGGEGRSRVLGRRAPVPPFREVVGARHPWGSPGDLQSRPP